MVNEVSESGGIALPLPKVKNVLFSIAHCIDFVYNSQWDDGRTAIMQYVKALQQDRDVSGA